MAREREGLEVAVEWNGKGRQHRLVYRAERPDTKQAQVEFEQVCHAIERLVGQWEQGEVETMPQRFSDQDMLEMQAAARQIAADEGKSIDQVYQELEDEARAEEAARAQGKAVGTSWIDRLFGRS